MDYPFLGGVVSNRGWMGAWGILGLLDKKARKGLWIASGGLTLIAAGYRIMNYYLQGRYYSTEPYITEWDWRIFWENSDFVSRSIGWWLLGMIVVFYLRGKQILHEKISWVLFAGIAGYVGVLVFSLSIGRIGWVEFRYTMPVIVVLHGWGVTFHGAGQLLVLWYWGFLG
ncbi:MAG: hypothetical protein ACUVRD_02595 [Bacteroidia bacterium]